MKKNIHPDWNHDCVVTCSCGNTFTTGSTLKTMQVDICNACHPFFTGEVKFVDRQGRVDKFLKKMKIAEAKKAEAKKKKKAKKDTVPQQSYKQILQTKQTQLKSKKSSSAQDDSTAKPSKAKQDDKAKDQAK